MFIIFYNQTVFVGIFDTLELAHESITTIIYQMIYYKLDKYMDYHMNLIKSELKGEPIRYIEDFDEDCKATSIRDEKRYSLLTLRIKELSYRLKHIKEDSIQQDFEIKEVEKNKVFMVITK